MPNDKLFDLIRSQYEAAGYAVESVTLYPEFRSCRVVLAVDGTYFDSDYDENGVWPLPMPAEQFKAGLVEGLLQLNARIRQITLAMRKPVQLSFWGV